MAALEALQTRLALTVVVAFADACIQVLGLVVVPALELSRASRVVAVVPALLTLATAPRHGRKIVALEALQTRLALAIVVALADARLQVLRLVVVPTLERREPGACRRGGLHTRAKQGGLRVKFRNRTASRSAAISTMQPRMSEHKCKTAYFPSHALRRPESI